MGTIPGGVLSLISGYDLARSSCIEFVVWNSIYVQGGRWYCNNG